MSNACGNLQRMFITVYRSLFSLKCLIVLGGGLLKYILLIL